MNNSRPCRQCDRNNFLVEEGVLTISRTNLLVAALRVVAIQALNILASLVYLFQGSSYILFTERNWQNAKKACGARQARASGIEGKSNVVCP